MLERMRRGIRREEWRLRWIPSKNGQVGAFMKLGRVDTWYLEK